MTLITRIEFLVFTIFLFGLAVSVVYPSNILLVCCCLATFFLIPFQQSAPWTKKTVRLVSCLTLIFLWIIFTAVYATDAAWLAWRAGFILKLGLGFLYFFALLFFVKNNLSKISGVVGLILIILVSLWYFQAIASYMSNSFFDYLDILGIRQTKGAAYFTDYTIFGRTLFRPTSIFNEPGTYCVSSYPLLLVYYLSKNKKLDLLVYLTIGSYILCLSSFGVLIAFLFLLAIVVQSEGHKYRFKKYSYWLLLLVISVISFGYFLLRFGTGSDQKGLGFRLEAIEILREQSFGEHLFGNGFQLIEITTRKNLLYTVYVEDLSFVFYSYYTLGLFFCGLIFYTFTMLVREKRDLFFILPIIFSKWAFDAYFFWPSIILVYFAFHYQKINHKNNLQLRVPKLGH